MLVFICSWWEKEFSHDYHILKIYIIRIDTIIIKSKIKHPIKKKN